MNSLRTEVLEQGKQTTENLGFTDKLLEFFFRPSSSHTLAVIRVATGLMLVYVHAIWLLGIEDFYGPNAILNLDTWRKLHAGQSPDTKWTYLAQTDSLTLASIHEWCAVFAGVMATLGLMTRTALFAAWLLTLLTVHRLTGYLFGLDQIVVMLSGYLVLSQAGSSISLDSLFSKKFPKLSSKPWYQFLSGCTVESIAGSSVPCWNNTVATRLIQLHLCIIYLFGGLGKLRGEMWWDGSAAWFSAAAYEYQSIDLTWIGNLPALGALMTHITLFWEVTYIAIIWPRWTRPIALILAVLVHGGIAIYLGMITFGWIMIVANMAFISPQIMRRIYPAALR